jgi:hypothetical protein
VKLKINTKTGYLHGIYLRSTFQDFLSNGIDGRISLMLQSNRFSTEKQFLNQIQGLGVKQDKCAIRI